MSGLSFHARWGAVALALALQGAAAGLTLEEAVQTALAGNRSLRVLAIQLDSRELGVAEARADFSVRLQPSGAMAADDEGGQSALGMEVAKKHGIGTEWSAEGGWSRTEYRDSPDVERGVVRVEVRQPLLRRLGRLVNEEPIVQARSEVQAARREIELRRTDLVVEVVEGYERLLRLERQRDFEMQALARSEQLLRLTRARERQGRATRVDVLRVDVQQGENRIRLARTGEDLANARVGFTELLGLEPGTAWDVTNAPVLEVEAPDHAEAERLALANRLDYAQVLVDREDAERGIRIARRNLLPDLDFVGRYTRDESTTGEFELDQDIWFVGLTADTDLRRQQERLALGQARLRSENARETIETIRSELRRQVQQVLSAYQRAREESLFAKRNWHMAENRARLARRMFEMGKGDNFSVTDAENALIEAQNRMLVSQAEVSISAYRMLRVLGTLLEYPEDLMPPAGGGTES